MVESCYAIVYFVYLRSISKKQKASLIMCVLSPCMRNEGCICDQGGDCDEMAT